MKTRITIAFTNHHSTKYTYSELNQCFNKRFGFTGEQYLKILDAMFLKKNFPSCKRIVINQWTGTSKYFYLTLQDENKTPITRITVDRGYSRNNYKFTNIDNDEAKTIIKVAVNNYNKKVFAKLCKTAGVSLAKNATNKVAVRYSNDYKPTDKITYLEGTVYEIIDNYVTMNDRLKYCNGSYYTWVSDDFEKVYSFFIANYNGNYFLDNAVRRGCIID